MLKPLKKVVASWASCCGVKGFLCTWGLRPQGLRFLLGSSSRMMEVFFPLCVCLFIGGGRLHRILSSCRLHLCSLLGCFSLVFLGGTRARVVVGGLVLDRVGGALILMTLWVGGLAIVAEDEGLPGAGTKRLVLLGILRRIAFVCRDLVRFYLFFERSLIPISWMIVYVGKSPERYRRVHYMVLYTLASSLPLLCWLLYLWVLCGSLFVWGRRTPVVCGWVGFMLIWAFLVKLPSFPWHIWLPKAHVEARVGGSMILAGVLLKLGGVGICRVMKFTGLDSVKALEIRKSLRV